MAVERLPVRLVSGTEPDEDLGAALAGACDVNGDGVADLVAGAPGSSAGGPGAGAVYLYLGSPPPPPPLTPGPNWTGELPDFEPERALELAEGDEGLLETVVKLFLERTPEQLEAIHRALDARDVGTVERTAHTMEGTAESLAMPRLRDIAHRIAVLSMHGDLEQAAALLTELDAAVGSGTSAVKDAVDAA